MESNPFASLTGTTVICGASELTATAVVNRTGTTREDVLLPYTDYFANDATVNGEWYEDIWTVAAGDGTVPLKSCRDQFVGDGRFNYLRPFFESIPQICYNHATIQGRQMTELEIRLLGGFSISHNGWDLKTSHADRLTLLLAYVFLNPSAPVSRKQLAFLSWPDSSEAQARTNLRNLLHLLRRTYPEADHFLEVDNLSIYCQPATTIHLDVQRFKNALVLAKSAQDEERMRLLQEAITSYQGELLPGFYEDWVLTHREELYQAYLGSLTQLARLLEDHGRYEEAIDIVKRILRNDPLNEPAYLLSMRLYALKEDRAGALQVYHTCATTLMRELGVEPGQEIRSLYGQLIGAGIETGEQSMRKTARERTRLIGRKEEWHRLREVWTAVQKGQPTLVAIQGEAGIGKTRLAGELLQWTRRQGILTAEAQSYAMETNLPFTPIISWLRALRHYKEMDKLEPLWIKEISRLLPELEEENGEVPPETQEWQRQRLFEALARGLLGSEVPRILFLDDIQWSDQETLEFIHFLLRYDPGSKLLILVTIRLEEMNTEHPLNQLRNSLLSRSQIREIELQPLTQADLALLGSDLLGKELNAETEALLFAESEGNPFFAVEMLRNGDFKSERAMPSSLRSVLVRRLNQLSPAAHDLAGLAAAIGREFNFSQLLDASQKNENQVVQALDELWSRRIVQVQSEDEYSFTHGKLQDAAYELLSPARRKTLHRRIAEGALAENAESALIASHFEKAGLYRQAIEHYFKAGEDARFVFANRDAIRHLEHALQLLTEKAGIKDEVQRQAARKAYETLGDLFEILNEEKRSVYSFKQALAHTASPETLAYTRTLGKLANITSYLGDYEYGSKLFTEALNALEAQPDHEDQEWINAWLKIQFTRAWIEYDRSEVDKLEPILAAIRPVAEQVGDPDTLSQYYFLAPLIDFRRYGYQATDNVQNFFKLAMEHGRKGNNLEVRTRGIFGYAFSQYLLCNCDEAIPLFKESLELAEQIGYIEQQILNLTYLATAYRRSGQEEQCRLIAERSLAFCEREHFNSYVASALANLGWVAWKQNDFERAKALNQQALTGWSIYYPFRWFGLWTLIEISLQEFQTQAALDYARLLKAPRQQVFAQAGDELLSRTLEAANDGNYDLARSFLKKAVDWAKQNHYL